MQNGTVVALDQIKFDDAWELQRTLYNARRYNKINDTILLLEHPHTFTIGKTGSMDHLLLNENQLSDENIYFSKIDRGGDITYHGPGQIVAYPILDMNNHYKDLHRYLRDLEQVIINTLNSYNVDAGRTEGLTGVWVNGAKICAIGVKVSRWITMHGLAFNHNPDLSFFKKIIPCGITDKPVCSLAQLLPKSVEKEELYSRIIESFSAIFDLNIERITLDELMERVNT